MKSYLKRTYLWAVAVVGLAASVVTSYAQTTFPSIFVGSYQAQLIVAPNYNTPVGSLDVTVAANGIASGKVTLPNKKSYSFKTSSALTVDGNRAYVTNLVIVKGKFPTGPQPLAFSSLQIYSDGNVIAGVLATTITPSGLYSAVSPLKFATFTGKLGSVAPWAGLYTMAMLPDQAEVTAGVPAGAGFATLTVAPNGTLSYKVTLGDGVKFAGSSKPSAEAQYRVFSSVYTTGGFFSTVIDLDDLGEQEVDATWNKPANAKDKKYKNGFAASLDVEVAAWVKLDVVKIPAAFKSSKNFAVDFSGEGLRETDFATTLPDTARFTGTGAVQAVSGGTGAAENDNAAWNKLWAVKLNPATGEFKGTQVLKTTVGSKTTSKKIPVAGVLLLDGPVGAEAFALGQYLVTPSGGTEISGLVSFTGPLEDNVSLVAAGTYEFKLHRTLVSAGGPSNAPAEGAWVKFILSDDMAVMTLYVVKGTGTTPVKLPLKSASIVGNSYGNSSISVTVNKNTTTGAITNVFGTFGSGAKVVIFATTNPVASNIRKL